MRLYREPAQWSAALSAFIQLATALVLPALGVSVSIDQQGQINAAAVLLAGFLAAWRVSQEKAAPLVAGVVQALIAVAVSFGFQLTPQYQAAIMTLVTAAYSMFLRTQVHAGGKHELR